MRAEHNGVVRFGPFEFAKSSGELRKHGIRIRIAGQPARLLALLLENAGEIVTREQIRERLWPDDVHVDFDSGLNAAMKKLRAALADSADSPIYVETIARNGYRFLAPVTELAAAPPLANLPSPNAPGSLPRRWFLAAPVIPLAAGAAYWWRSRPQPETFRFRQLTFRRGPIAKARYTAKGGAIVYQADWDRGPRQLYRTSALSPESAALPLEDFGLLAISDSEELALSKIQGTLPVRGGEVYRAPLNGGTPVLAEHNVMSADFAPGGKHLALSRLVDGRSQLECPPGRILHRTNGWLSSVRVSPDATRIAFFEHAVRHDDAGRLLIVNAAAPSPTPLYRSENFSSTAGLAWDQDGASLCFSASRSAALRSVWRWRAGRIEPVLSGTGSLSLHDIAPGGRLLLSRDARRLEMYWRAPAAIKEITWHDWSRPVSLSRDAGLLLFDESGDAVGGKSTSYLYTRRDGSVRRLGELRAVALSPDGKSALLMDQHRRTRLFRMHLAEGKLEALPDFQVEVQWALYLPDGKSLLAGGSRPGESLRIHRITLDPSSRVDSLTGPTVTRNVVLSPEGDRAAYLGSDNQLTILDLRNGARRTVSAASPLAPVHWRASGGDLIVHHAQQYTEIPARLSLLDPESGRLRPYGEISFNDPTGINLVTRILFSGDENHCVYSCRRVLSELFQAEPVAAGA